ncbi:MULTISPECIES: ECF transporter S component [Paenarthrobacter]|jgi:energy-coupling factor transport system substrate-specific component|uniref:ECF transporter S component n=1 Tax=Paenarthrobacter TaxID=1742992 RepID=UPI00057D4CBA|nr:MULTISPECIES: ECF transporter S component [Paenarthrobacter]KIA71442.1 integral membrane protein [Arthrobacter sp. MWB30]BCW12314.1 ABC transporter permease [Arthrobacter sp. NtRootA2]BCW16396.1 ABC transporter permease [Arthrobacter sp. NtRootA4]BCW24729.1 ABC transporter permease [Arthrobacter sp. NtRootC7]BCW28999.1 ABC transporter permease [Arthrobacter sp. NtRootC45]BCW33269.1 ABC transporter permease [Arthrobacter sp. NtRootD5]
MTTVNVKKTSYSWRVVDIVVAALIAIAGGVIFWAWSQGAALVSIPMNAAYPPLTGLIAGGWMIPAVLGMLIIRKPGAALFCEAVAATGELIMGSQYGTTVLISGVLQGLGAELIFAAFRYKKFNLPTALLAGAGAGLFCGLNDSFLPWGWNIAYEAIDKLTYITFTTISGAVIAGGLSWIATRGLATTGVLSSFASRKAASEPVFN